MATIAKQDIIAVISVGLFEMDGASIGAGNMFSTISAGLFYDADDSDFPAPPLINIISATYNSTALTITITGTDFDPSRGTGKVEYKKTLDSTWAEVSGYTSWSDTSIVVTVASALSDGFYYDIRVTDSNDDIDTLSSAFVTKVLNKSFKLGMNRSQGIGFSENKNTYYPMPKGRVGILNIVDNNNNKHALIFDSADRTFYAIDLYDGPSNTGNTAHFKNKVTISGLAGYDLTPTVTFKEDRGEYERFFLRVKSDSVYMRPYNPSTGFPSGLQIDLSVYKDGEPTTALVTAEDITPPKNEVHFDRIIDDCHRAQTKFVANMAPFRITGRQNDYIVYDKQDDPDGKKSSEDTWQENIAPDTVWVSRGCGIKNKITGNDLTYTGTITCITGPDSKTESAIAIGTTLSLGNAAIANGTLLLWHKTGYSITGVSLTQVTTSGSWILSKATGSIPTSLVLTTGSVFDIRLDTSVFSTADIAYYYTDVINNSGNNVMDLF